ncbi:hypothetical protein [Flavobacterium sp.]|uniref:hypothetical protein n=1 Tax=Flavobacterium sp. TaxID=239 RepID=UPI0039E71F52
MKTTITNPIRTIVAHYDSHDQAENAIIRLQQNGHEMNRFSIVATDLYTSEKVLGYYDAYDLMKKWAFIGGFYSGFWGLLFGFSTYSIPIIGPSLIQGWIGAIIAGLVLGIVGAVLSAISAAVYFRFSNKRKVKYRTDVKAAHYLLLADENIEINNAREILQFHIPKQKYAGKDWRTERKAP